MSDDSAAGQSSGQAAVAVAGSVKPTKITKLILDGFKSFGRRTELLFDDGFNCVLGPNGSGKSNILDALCFVLGKRSTKELRAEKASNLIYNGGKTKNPAKIAEVSIVFDNSKSVFPVPEDTVKITRLVRQDGMSKYKINGKTRTRQEILELLGAAKINPDGYNIILQGDIVRLVEMSPIERRQIVEEIAGISVYEEKKQQALNELMKVDEKLGEAAITLRERKSRLDELRNERDQALKHKELNDKIKQNKASYCKRQIDRKTEERARIEKKSSKHREKLEKFQESIGALRTEIQQRKDSIQAINREIERTGDSEHLKLQKEVEHLHVAIETGKQRIAACHNEISKVRQRKEQLKKDIEDLDNKIAELKSQASGLGDRKKFVEEQVADLDKKIREFKKKHQLDQDSELDAQIEQLDKDSEEKQKQLQLIREQQQALVREKDKIEFTLQTIDSQISRVLELEQQHKEEIKILKNKKEQFKKTVLELNELLNKDSEDAGNLSTSKSEIQKLQEERAKLEVKQAGMREILGSNMAVQKVLENRQKLGEIYGTVAELGQTEAKYALALEVAAAQKVHSIVVEDDQVAARAIKFLRQGKLGVATFLPLNKIRAQPVKEETKGVLKQPGVVGLAIDLIDFEPKFKDVFSHVFGNTVVVDTIDTARRIGIGKAKMVTLDGDLCELSGAMTGGHRHKKTGTFKEKEVVKALEEIDEKLSKLEKGVTKLEETRKESEERIARLRELKANLEGEIIKMEKSLHIDSGDLDANKAYKEELQKKLNGIDLQLKSMEDRIVGETQALTQIKIKRQELKNRIMELRNPRLLAELNAYDQKRKEFLEEMMGITGELKNLETQSNEIFGKEREGKAKVLRDLDNEAEAFMSEIEDLNKLISQQQESLKAKEEEQGKFQSQFKSLFDKQKVLQDEINQREQEILGLEEQARKEELALNTFGLEITRMNVELASLETEFAQYSGVELDMEKPEEKLKEEIAEFEKLMITIGNVNLRALDVYDVAEKEFNELVQKKDVLVSEKNEVLKLMEEIEASKKGLFMNTLNIVNSQFQRFFSSLSTKGEAYLELENPEMPFEAGLGIKVRLTGNKFLDIRSLSGGEKTMTALAFLFAIQEHEPAAFYILDEVDAALDKANSDKLTKLIREYCKKAQYVVISHNDNIIAEADTLYGVSMDSEKGISNVVSLRA
ncbi:MAG: chromosome segregation protein SMC [Candidatus Woesearchaeota archaeon]